MIYHENVLCKSAKKVKSKNQEMAGSIVGPLGVIKKVKAALVVPETRTSLFLNKNTFLSIGYPHIKNHWVRNGDLRSKEGKVFVALQVGNEWTQDNDNRPFGAAANF